MDISYYLSTPDGAADNSYTVINDYTLNDTINTADQAKADVSASFTHIVDQNDSTVSYLISRSDPNIQVMYNDFTPTSNALPLVKDTFYYPEDNDFMANVIAQNPGVDFDANPELIPYFCLVSTVEQNYTFDIPAV